MNIADLLLTLGFDIHSFAEANPFAVAAAQAFGANVGLSILKAAGLTTFYVCIWWALHRAKQEDHPLPRLAVELADTGMTLLMAYWGLFVLFTFIYLSGRTL
jgi:hypothetical protein|tara:strand:+ start:127 stop:432 length:306 start_codon:yes stop_codon:yes gene_type:complete